MQLESTEKQDFGKKFNFRFQIKVLALLIRDKQFFSDFVSYLSPEYFSEIPHQAIFSKIQALWHAYGQVASLEVLLEEIDRIEEAEVRELSLRSLGEALDVDLQDAEYYRTEVYRFCQFQNTVRALRKAAKLVKSGEIEAVLPSLEKEILSFGHLSEKDGGSSYWDELGLPDVEIDLPKIPTLLGSPDHGGGLDEALNGGLGREELGMLMMPTGRGKSVFLVNIAGNAMIQSKNVIFISLEMTELKLRRRFNQFFSGCTEEQLRKMQPGEIKEKIHQEYLGHRLGNLVIKRFPMRGVGARQIEAYVRKAEKQFGWRVDLVCVDYLDVVKPPYSNREEWQRLGDVAEELKGLAQRLSVPVWTATQVNRRAAGKNLITNEDSSGSYAKIFPADVVISMSPRNDEEEDKRYARLFVAKNRNGSDQQTLDFELRFEVMRYCYIGKKVKFNTVQSAALREFKDARKKLNNPGN